MEARVDTPVARPARVGVATPTFLILLGGLVVSLVGDGIYNIGMTIFVKNQTQSMTQLAIVQVFFAVPQLIIGLFAGVFADRLDRRRLVLISDLGRALLVLVPAMLFFGGQLRVWHTWIISVMLSSFSALYMPSLYASLPDIVGENGLTRANSIVRIALSLSSIAGAILGGIVVLHFGCGWAFLLNAISFLAAAVAVCIIRFESRGTASAKKNVLADLGQGLSYLLGTPVLFGMISIFVVLNFSLGPTSVTVPSMALDILKLDESGLGWLRSSLAIGGLLGSLAIGLLGEVRRKGLAITRTIVAFGLAVASFGFTRSFVAALCSLFAVGLLLAVVNILIPVLFQGMVPSEMRGRALSTLWTVSSFLNPVSIYLGGVLTDKFSAPPIVIASGILAALCGLAGVFLKGIREV